MSVCTGAVPPGTIKRKSKKNSGAIPGHNDLVPTPPKVVKSISAGDLSPNTQPPELDVPEYTNQCIDNVVFIPNIEPTKPTDWEAEIEFMKSLHWEILQQKFLEGQVHRIADLPAGTLITVHSYRIDTNSKFGRYPIIRGTFGDETDAELSIPSRYIQRIEDRPLPFHAVYTGAYEYEGKTVQRIEFVNMKLLKRVMNNC